MVLKELVFDYFYFGRVWWFERTNFEKVLLWEGVVVLKELILNSFYFGRVMVVLKELILNSFYFGRMW